MKGIEVDKAKYEECVEVIALIRVMNETLDSKGQEFLRLMQVAVRNYEKQHGISQQPNQPVLH